MIFVIVGPTAVGKSTIVRIIRQAYPQVNEVVSVTTRPIRNGETDGVEFRFLDRDGFMAMVHDGLLAEWGEFEGHLYGTPLDCLDVAPGRTLVNIMDTVGASKMKSMLGDEAVTIFIMPPDEDALRERFLRRNSGEDLESRLARAKSDMAMSDGFDHVVINDDLASSARRVIEIIGL